VKQKPVQSVGRTYTGPTATKAACSEQQRTLLLCLIRNKIKQFRILLLHYVEHNVHKVVPRVTNNVVRNIAYNIVYNVGVLYCLISYKYLLSTCLSYLLIKLR
jgi:hypothetical protein